MKVSRAASTAVSGLGVLLLWASSSLAQLSDGGYRVFRADGPGPHPAVAFLSGCSGFAPSFAPKVYERLAEELRVQGYMVLFVDYLGRRGLQSCAGPQITYADAAKDLVAAVAWLRSAVKKNTTPDAVKTVIYPGAHHAFDVSELPAKTRYPYGTIGHHPQAAAAAWEEVQQFLKATNK